MLSRYQVSEVLYPDLAFESAVYDEWLKLIKEREIKSTLAQAGQQISLGDWVVIELLSPRSHPLSVTESDVDNNAAVLRLSLNEVSFLLTADIMREAEFELLYDRANLRSTVRKVAHHGADTSTTLEFLAVVNPQLAVISVGADNDYGHPSVEVMARLIERVDSANIYRTDEDGTIEFTTHGERLWVKTER